MILSALENKRIAIWGMGREGVTTLAFLKNYFPDQQFIIINRDPIKTDETFIAEEEMIEHLSEIDIIIKSPGISYYHENIQKMLEAGIVVTSATSIWFQLSKKGTVIAITGSNGKSTTSALTHHILEVLGKNAAIGGNIGTPLLSLPLDTDYYVVELSSYQTCDLEGVPDIAVLLNLYPEHIQWHHSHAQYYHDKCNLLRQGAKINIVNHHEPRTADIAEHSIKFGCEDAIHFENSIMMDGGMKIGYLEGFPLLGVHNLENLSATLTICQQLDLDLRECLEAAKSYPGLPHRLQIFGPHNDNMFVNDSISTDPEATIAALEALNEKNVTLIVGGEDREQDYSVLANAIDQTGTRAICVYETGPRLFDLIKSGEKYRADRLEDAVTKAKEITPKGGYIVLSPAAPSYDAFKDFEERGDLFIKYAKT